MKNKKILSKKNAMNCTMGVTHIFKLNGKGIKDSQAKKMIIENPPTIERCKKHVHVYGSFAKNVAMVIKSIMEEYGFDVAFDHNDKEDVYYVAYTSQTHSDDYIESVFTQNLEVIFEETSNYIDNALRNLA